MSTLYFYNTTDNNWDTLTNWYTDLGITPSCVLPSNGDIVYIATEIDSGPSVIITLGKINIADSSTGGGAFSVTITNSLGPAIFNGGSWNNGTTDNNTTFNDYSSNGENGSTGDNATFNDYSSNNNGNGYVGYNATFNDYSYNNFFTLDNTTFNDYSSNGGMVNDNTIFNDYSYNGINARTLDNTTFNDYSYNINVTGDNTTFNDYSYNGINARTLDNTTFNDYSYNINVTGDNTTFNDYSYSDSSSSNGTATFNDVSYFKYGCIIHDAVSYRNTGLILIPPTNKVTINTSYGMDGGTKSIGTMGKGINGSDILGII